MRVGHMRRVYATGQWPHRVEDTTIHDWSSLARYSARHTFSSLDSVYLVNLMTELMQPGLCNSQPEES
jgi:hypothetical protein